jgi:hypothetical protein
MERYLVDAEAVASVYAGSALCKQGHSPGKPVHMLFTFSGIDRRILWTVQ